MSSRPFPPPAPPRFPRAPHTPSSAPVDLDGNVKLGIKTLLTLFVIVVGSVTSVMGVWSTLVTKHDLSGVMADHIGRQDAHPETNRTLKEIQQQTINTASRTKRLEEKQEETSSDVSYIRSRIDFLTERAVRDAAEQSQNRPRVSSPAGERAVQKLRASGDPNQVLDDL